MSKSHSFANRGFHLIELLIVMSLIALLTTISAPIYSHFMLQAHRLEASLALQKASLSLEYYYQEHGTYVGANLTTLHIPTDLAKHQYEIRLEQATSLDFLLIAEPLDKQTADVACGALTLNALGIKNIRGNGNAFECWG